MIRTVTLQQLLESLRDAAVAISAAVPHEICKVFLAWVLLDFSLRTAADQNMLPIRNLAIHFCHQQLCAMTFWCSWDFQMSSQAKLLRKFVYVMWMVLAQLKSKAGMTVGHYILLLFLSYAGFNVLNCVFWVVLHSFDQCILFLTDLYSRIMIRKKGFGRLSRIFFKVYFTSHTTVLHFWAVVHVDLRHISFKDSLSTGWRGKSE